MKFVAVWWRSFRALAIDTPKKKYDPHTILSASTCRKRNEYNLFSICLFSCLDRTRTVIRDCTFCDFACKLKIMPFSCNYILTLVAVSHSFLLYTPRTATIQFSCNAWIIYSIWLTEERKKCFMWIRTRLQFRIVPFSACERIKSTNEAATNNNNNTNGKPRETTVN